MAKLQHEHLALETALGDESGDPIAIPLSVLSDITKNFSDDKKIGSGGFGDVYKVRAHFSSHLRSWSPLKKKKKNLRSWS